MGQGKPEILEDDRLDRVAASRSRPVMRTWLEVRRFADAEYSGRSAPGEQRTGSGRGWPLLLNSASLWAVMSEHGRDRKHLGCAYPGGAGIHQSLRCLDGPGKPDDGGDRRSKRGDSWQNHVVYHGCTSKLGSHVHWDRRIACLAGNNDIPAIKGVEFGHSFEAAAVEFIDSRTIMDRSRQFKRTSNTGRLKAAPTTSPY